MRILHLIHSEGVYGAETILLYLAREQQSRGHQPLIASIRDPGTPETRFEALAAKWRLPVIAIRIAPRPTPGVIKTLLGAVHQATPDVLHSHGYKANILLGPVPRRRRGAMLATVHGWTNTRMFTRMWLYERLERLALRRLDAVVAVSKQMLALPALRALPTARRRVIENGIPPLETRLADLVSRGAAPLPHDLVAFVARRPTLVAIGRLSAEKHFALLLEAYARARARLPGGGHQLVVVGEGPERDALVRRTDVLGLRDVVRFPGYVDGADRLLERASGFVMSSLTEGMPLVLLEAMQWQVPILATAVGAIPELLGAGSRGALVAPNDAAAFSDALHAMMSRATSVADQRVRAATSAVARQYSSARMVEEYFDAYGAIA